MKKFINFLESLKNNENKQLIEIVEQGYNYCFEYAEYDPEKPKFKKTHGFGFDEWMDKVNKIIKKRTKKSSIDDFKHVNFHDMYEKDYTAQKAFKPVMKELDDSELKPLSSQKAHLDLGERLQKAGEVSPTFKIASELYGIGKNVKGALTGR